MLPWMAALDQPNHFKWSSIFLIDMRNFQLQLLTFFPELIHSKQANQVKSVFFLIGIDQAYEQNNNIVKIDGVAVGIFHNKRTLLEWVLAGPYVSTMIFESSNNMSTSHYKDTNLFDKEFQLRHSLLIEVFQK